MTVVARRCAGPMNDPILLRLAFKEPVWTAPDCPSLRTGARIVGRIIGGWFVLEHFLVLRNVMDGDRYRAFVENTLDGNPFMRCFGGVALRCVDACCSFGVLRSGRPW